MKRAGIFDILIQHKIRAHSPEDMEEWSKIMKSCGLSAANRSIPSTILKATPKVALPLSTKKDEEAPQKESTIEPAPKMMTTSQEPETAAPTPAEETETDK